eukprot:TRINITY_DN10409_c0_g1_i1.p1 TRINITY_DN10409_c0_g1~~TRINITY_DN10409_c0_g1_i1.p1  ORF type:complete len:261 (+),score=57.07 TRINITY_DN10409_c0_g1_i1:83-784(+)
MARPAIGDRHVLDRRIPASKKYDGARSTVDSGNNVLNTRAPPSGPRPEEHFKRMRCSALHRHLTAAPEDREKEVVLIDVRDRGDYERAHIEGALHYPPALLTRAVNPFLPEMFAAKNKEGRCIVAYDLDDSAVQKVASLIFEKGIDNIYVLHGGLQEYVREFAGHVVGDPPPPPQDDRRPVRRAPGTSCAGSTLAPSDACSTISHSAVSNASSFKPKPLSSSLARSSAAPSWR